MVSLRRPLLTFAKGILAKSLIKLLGTELLIGGSLVLLSVYWINLLHLFFFFFFNTSLLWALPFINPRACSLVCKSQVCAQTAPFPMDV